MLKRFGVSIEDDLIRQFDELIRRRGFQNRSDALRHLIREKLVEQDWHDTGGEVVGAVTIVYDHDTMQLARKLTKLQHEVHGLVVSSMHIHLDAHHCMETLIVRGRPAAVEAVANRLIHARGVKHGRLFRTRIGE